MTKTDEKVLLDTGTAPVLRTIAALFVPSGAAMVAASFWILTSLPKTDGTLEPLDARIALFCLTFITGLLMSIGLWIYLQLYPLKIVRNRKRVRITTTRIITNITQEFDTSELSGGRRYEGAGSYDQPNTPFQTLRIRGWLLPLILDEKAKIFDPHAIEHLRRS